MKQTIHVTTQEQLNQCLDIRKEVFVREQKVDISLEIDEFDESPQACYHILLLEDGKPTATGRMRPYTDDTMKLQRIAVRQSSRGTGAGRAIVLGLEEEAKRIGYAYTLLDAQCQAEPFYAKLGYVTISEETFLDAGIPHVRMKKTL
ncbi:GNAT family N-acetyltransferase [Paenibacillus sp. OAS669]|uniref:GNAT family N-acetyltransferase n=1 Tax=Paenibacillus sp. OAS669 TaxID=2663821 RepID=UPI00178978F0|nr:GNAT family N-acetyltransferase [Paenibacillus sp. OAS669]MBE1446915.1 putative GNAT family N-acyltransferase [Paenibacillus sp. OAS669]